MKHKRIFLTVLALSAAAMVAVPVGAFYAQTSGGSGNGNVTVSTSISPVPGGYLVGLTLTNILSNHLINLVQLNPEVFSYAPTITSASAPQGWDYYINNDNSMNYNYYEYVTYDTASKSFSLCKGSSATFLFTTPYDDFNLRWYATARDFIAGGTVHI